MSWVDRSKLKGKVQTVLGLIEPNDLGIVLPHEHLLIDQSFTFAGLNKPEAKELAYQRISLSNLSWVRSHKLNSQDNLQISDIDTTICEANKFKKAGGNTIVDVTPNNIGRSSLGLVKIARATGLNVVMSTGYYTEQSYCSAMKMNSRTEEDIAEEFIKEIMNGVDNTDTRAGLIGELGCSWPLTIHEKKVLRGAAIAQEETGAVINIHFQGGSDESPFEIVEVLVEAGADQSRIIMSHMTLVLPISARNKRAKLAELGCYLEYDLFGTDGIYSLDTTPYDNSNDTMRIKQIMDLITDGHLNNILISQDVCLKIHLCRFGGMGYSHILHSIVPLMLKKGLTEEQIKTIMVENPKRALVFV